ncbi:1226_t:CDS:2 [Cetraspora pellucida]|uniref:1223_t:CDS:1 n=2 Tax=Cetraspora pellucida TaxID=1433469 RepID=A0ACA9L1V1_9GLOM|nr:1223_t:CDS:2 [Cetraspora pellucida]CAG8504043.1 1226_t:CDS:2 [Cetraspora pellucida]
MNDSTFFDNLTISYCDVPITEDGIDTITFLNATHELVKLLDIIGPEVFEFFRGEMNSNIKNIRERFEHNKSKNLTLEKLIKHDESEYKTKNIHNLVLLTRQIEFIAVGLRRSINDPNEELAVSFTESYKITLERHHNIVLRPIFRVAIKACPYRHEFFQKLGNDQEKVYQQYESWLSSLEGIIKRLYALPEFHR